MRCTTLVLFALLTLREVAASTAPLCCQHTQAAPDHTSPLSFHFNNYDPDSFAPYEKALSRYRRESHSLIAPFDISKMWRKNLKIKSEATVPSASSLRSHAVGVPLASTASAIISTAAVDTLTKAAIAFTEPWEGPNVAAFRTSAPKTTTKELDNIMLTSMNNIDKSRVRMPGTQRKTRLVPTGSINETRLVLSGRENETWLVLSGGDNETRQVLSGGDNETRLVQSSGDNETRLVPSGGDNEPWLVLSGRENETRLVLSAGDNETWLVLSAGDKETRLVQSSGDNETRLVPSGGDNEPWLVLSGRENETRLVLSAGDNETQLVLSAGDNETRLVLSGRENETRLVLSAGDNETRLVLSGRENETRLVLSGGDNETQLVLSGGDNETRLVLSGGDNETRLVLSGGDNETRLVLSGGDNETVAWPVKRAATLDGDIILGGLMMVHSRSELATCGPVMAQGGVQALEAMLFALDRAAAVGLAPPGVVLGAHVLDDCDNDTYGLEMALDFIKGSIRNIDDAEYSCNASARALRKVISGVVGAASSVTSVQVANLLRLFQIPQVSFFSTSPELSNKARFEYFSRTIPSDLHQARAMVAIVKKLGWKYVSVVYEESNYGIKAFEELEALLGRNDICIAVKERLVKDSGEADERAYDGIVTRLLARPRARGVIVFGSDQEVAGVMAAAGRLGATRWFGWVGSDGWSERALVSAGNEAAVEGTISVQPQANPVRGFREYFLNLTVENNRRNPWFVEFWEDHFKCRYPGAARTPYNAQYESACSGREQLSADNIEFEAQLQFVTDAVLAFAVAIRDMHAELCGGRHGLCAAMRPASGAALLHFLRRARFTGLSGDEFRFDAAGDGPARYNILHYKQVARGEYRWLKVGRYLDGALELDMHEIQFKWESPRPPESVCSAECELGQAKQYVEGESCCWHCFNCTQYEIRSPLSETACVECPLGTLPDRRRVRCARVPELYLRPDSPAAIGAMVFSALGMLLTTLVAGIWFTRGDTPVVRASGRELSFVLLGGIMLCYLVTFALVFRPTDGLCAVQRFGTGFCFTVVYASLLTKTNRIARIFAASKQSALRPQFISPKSQLLICTALVSIQVVVVVVWQVVSPARAVHHYPSRADNMLVCDSYVDASYTIAFFYPVLLILTCTVYAVLTRKIPEAFNESKHIGFTMYTTCVIWLAFVPLYLGTANLVPLRVTSMAITISLSASVTLVCLFSPKLYIIVCRPERNVRASLMTGKWQVVGRAGGPGRRGAAGGAVCAALVGAAHAPIPCAPVPDLTPSTDLSTLNDTERMPFSDRHVQTEETALYPRLALPSEGLCLDARHLRELGARAEITL